MAVLLPNRNSLAGTLPTMGSRLGQPKKQYMSIHKATLAPLDPLPDSNKSDIPQESNNLRTLKFNSSAQFNTPEKPTFPSLTSLTPDPPQNIRTQLSFSSDNLFSEPTFKQVAPLCRYSIASIQTVVKAKLQSQSDMPVIDIGVPNIIRICCASFVHDNIKLGSPPQLPSVTSPNFSSVLRKKLAICSTIFDFSRQNDQLPEKELKARAMCEFIELFENDKEISQLSEDCQNAIFKMLEYNILSQDPTVEMQKNPYDFSINIVEVNWPHLFYCYQIFNRFIQLFPNLPAINIKLVKKLINLTQIADTNERMQLVAFLRSYYNNRVNDRDEILSMIKEKLLEMIDGIAKPYCVMPLIILLTHIYSKSRTPSSSQYVDTILQAVLPLISLPYMPIYQANIRQLLTTFLSGNGYYTTQVLRGIEIRWPQTSFQMQLYVFDILLNIFDRLDSNTFKPMARRVFQFIADCVESPNYKLVQNALDMWKIATLENWIGQNARYAIKAMYEPVFNISEKYYIKATMEKANEVLGEMSRIHKTSYQKMKSYVKQIRSKRLRPRVPNDTQRGWVAIARAAAERQTEINGKADFDLNEKLQLFYDVFHNEKKVTLMVSRFIPIIEKKNETEDQKE